MICSQRQEILICQSTSKNSKTIEKRSDRQLCTQFCQQRAGISGNHQKGTKWSKLNLNLGEPNANLPEGYRKQLCGTDQSQQIVPWSFERSSGLTCMFETAQRSLFMKDLSRPPNPVNSRYADQGMGRQSMSHRCRSLPCSMPIGAWRQTMFPMFSQSLQKMYSCRQRVKASPGNFILILPRRPCQHFAKASQTANFDKRDHYKKNQSTTSRAYVSTLHLPKGRSGTSYLQATCVGQAANPGPGMSSSPEIRWIHVNPTAIHGKVPMLHELGATILCCSETSATAHVQAITTKEFRALGVASIWSSPAAPHRQTDNPSPEIRGKATGLSMHSCLPIRKAPGLSSTVYHAASRLMRSFVSIGAQVVQVIQLYGYPKPAQDAKEATEKLAHAACTEAFELNMPTILVGDINHHPTTLPSFQVLLEQGYKTSEQLYREIHHEAQPPTCRGATRNDVFLVSKHIQPWITDVFVCQHTEFADHSPIGLAMKVPSGTLTKTILRRPHTWIDRMPATQAIQTTYEALKKEGPVNSFATWASRCEQAVHKAIQKQHADDPDAHPFQGLKRAQRGRCKPPKFVKVPVSQPMKPAGPSQYNPQIAQASSAFRQCLRQLRRIQSLYRRLRKLHAAPELRPDWTQMAQEWQAIMQAKILEMPFARWISQQPELEEPAQFLPSLGQLFHLQQLFAHQVRQLEAQEKKKQQEAQAYQRVYDKKWGSHRQAFRSLRKPTNPCLQEVWVTTTHTISILTGQGTGLLEGQLEENVQIPPRAKLQLHGTEVLLCNQKEAFVDLMLLDADCDIPNQCNLAISVPTMEPTKIGAALHHYWSKFWQRDAPEDQWNTFGELLSSVPPLPSLQPKDPVAMWTWAIRNLKKTTARGTCGWATEELQQLPLEAIEDLVQLLASTYPDGFPEEMMLARTLPIGKIPDPSLPEQTRPITILSLLYRTWGKACCTQVLRHWSQVMPKEIVGFIPTRNMNLHMIRYQHSLELSQADHQEASGGLTLDLTKAFNLIGREPARKALCHAGIPTNWVSQWYGSQMAMTRTWEVASHALSPQKVTTGAPEGDTWSVLCMLSLSYVWVSLLQQRCSEAFAPSAYADNLGWMTSHEQDHSIALRTTEEWARALKFQIDWNKTWVWANGPDYVHKWKQISQTRQCPLHRLTNARELGYMLAYNKKHNKLTFRQRMQDALHQLGKIARLPHDLQTKALLTKAPLAKAVYATEISAIGHTHFTKLRRAITKSLLGPHTQANPFVAMVTLSRFVQDPLLTFAVHCVRQIRLFLLQALEEERLRFYAQTATHSGEPLKVRGPAGALKYNLTNLALGFDARGNILVDGFVELHLLHAPWEQIQAAMTQAWLEQVPHEIGTRKNWRQAPLINEHETKRLLASFPAKSQKILAYEITGAYQTAQQKVKWTQLETPTCPHCGEEDSVLHRRLWCPALQSTRDDFGELTAELEDMNPILVDLPVVFQNEHANLDRCLAWKAPCMQPNWEVLQMIQEQIAARERPLLFTDGSASPPDVPYVRKAAFAIVYLPLAAEKMHSSLLMNILKTFQLRVTFRS